MNMIEKNMNRDIKNFRLKLKSEIKLMIVDLRL